jgi:hypothetical protein
VKTKNVTSYVIDGIATVTCPACYDVVRLETRLFKKNSLPARCKCGEKFNLKLEARRHYRKEFNTTGAYRIYAIEGINIGKINIKNISRTGVGFTVTDPEKMRIGMKMTICFSAHNGKKYDLEKKVVARNIDKNYIGCDFSAKIPEYQSLKFHLQQ